MDKVRSIKATYQLELGINRVTRPFNFQSMLPLLVLPVALGFFGATSAHTIFQRLHVNGVDQGCVI